MSWRSLLGRYGTRAATLTALALVSCVVAAAAWILVDSRAVARRQAEQSASNLVLGLERDISRNIGIYDLSLRSAAAAFTFPELGSLRPEVRQAVLFDGATAAPYFGLLALLNPAGEVVYEFDVCAPDPKQSWRRRLVR